MFGPTHENIYSLEHKVHFSLFVLQVTIPESVAAGKSVLAVAATDLESNEYISYRILSSSKEFSIDPMNGE